MVYAATYTTGDLTNMGVDTAGGVMHATASQSGNVASLGILGGTIMPQLTNVTKGAGTMVTSIGGASATATAEKASANAKKMCASCQAKK